VETLNKRWGQCLWHPRFSPTYARGVVFFSDFSMRLGVEDTGMMSNLLILPPTDDMTHMH
jgi:hypothetical protein